MSVTSGARRKEGGIAETGRVIFHALIIALVIRTFLFQPFNIPSGSMKATLLVGDYLYGYSDKGGWTCQDFKSGDVKWQEKKLGKGAIHCADGMLYLLEESSGTAVLIEASPDGWKEHGRFKLEPQTTQRKPQGKIWVHPVVSNGKLYLRDQELIFCFDVKG